MDNLKENGNTQTVTLCSLKYLFNGQMWLHPRNTVTSLKHQLSWFSGFTKVFVMLPRSKTGFIKTLHTIL